MNEPSEQSVATREKPKREDGAYWVKLYPTSCWSYCVYYSQEDLWHYPSDNFFIPDKDFYKIHEERILNPDEK